jgi:hypothetical protein
MYSCYRFYLSLVSNDRVFHRDDISVIVKKKAYVTFCHSAFHYQKVVAMMRSYAELDSDRVVSKIKAGSKTAKALAYGRNETLDFKRNECFEKFQPESSKILMKLENEKRSESEAITAAFEAQQMEEQVAFNAQQMEDRAAFKVARANLLDVDLLEIKEQEKNRVKNLVKVEMAVKTKTLDDDNQKQIADVTNPAPTANLKYLADGL